MIPALELSPSPLAFVGARLRTIGPDRRYGHLYGGFVSFRELNQISSHMPAFAGLEEKSRDHSYRTAYDLVRADGLGTWMSAIEKMTSMPAVSFLPAEFTSAVEWFTRRRSRPEDAWCKDAIRATESILTALGVECSKNSRESVRTLVGSLVQIRNKTRGHGALGPDFYDAFNAKPIQGQPEARISQCRAIQQWTWSQPQSQTGTVSFLEVCKFPVESRLRI